MRTLCVLLFACTFVGAEDEKELIARLASASSSEREEAARELGRLRVAAAVPALIECLIDDAPGVRAAAVGALGKIGHADAVAPLARLLVDKQLGQAAFDALVAIGLGALPVFVELVKDPETRPPTLEALAETDLLKALASNESWHVRMWAIRQAGRNKQLDKDWLGILSTLQAVERSGAVRYAIARTLAAHAKHNATARIRLVESLQDKEARVRRAAAWGLGDADRLGSYVVESLIKALRDPEQDVRNAAALSLAKAEDQKPAIAALKQDGGLAACVSLARLGDWDDTVIASLVDALLEWGVRPPYGSRRNLRAAGGSYRINVLPHAVKTLIAGPPKAAAALVRALEKADVTGRLRIVHALGYMKQVPLEALVDKDARVRLAAALSQPRKEALPVLLAKLGKSRREDWAVRVALKEIGPAALPGLLKHYESLLKKANPEGLDTNVVSMPGGGSERLIRSFGKEALAEALKDPSLHPYVREHFARR